jgi:tRNA1Val (adenine37-N6)-methyltransferase
MSNSFFKFKEFTVHQDKTAMKVCTDACLFGAWVVDNVEMTSLKNILDIGTGTGLLSLMLAQFSQASINAVEIEPMAVAQANENFKASKWKEQLHIHATSIIEYTKKQEKQFDLIISNPPFFEQQLKSNNTQRNIAMHSANLTLTELANCMIKLLTDSGKAAILLPWNRSEEWKEIAEKMGLFCIKEAAVKQSTSHSYFRTMIIMQKKATISNFDAITIKEGNEYSKEFSQLLAPYYLAL